MTTLDDLLQAGDERKDRTRQAGLELAGYLRVGLWSIGWLLAKTLTLLLAIVAGVFFIAGWACARAVPVLKWVRTAFMLGWEAGRARGPA